MPIPGSDIHYIAESSRDIALLCIVGLIITRCISKGVPTPPRCYGTIRLECECMKWSCGDCGDVAQTTWYGTLSEITSVGVGSVCYRIRSSASPCHNCPICHCCYAMPFTRYHMRNCVRISLPIIGTRNSTLTYIQITLRKIT